MHELRDKAQGEYWDHDDCKYHVAKASLTPCEFWQLIESTWILGQQEFGLLSLFPTPYLGQGRIPLRISSVRMFFVWSAIGMFSATVYSSTLAKITF